MRNLGAAAVVLITLFPPACLAIDCNGNGIPDSDDITAGTSKDCNGNGIPDECDITMSDPVIAEAFDSVPGIAAKGWVTINHSQPIGTTNWFQGTAAVFTSHAGVSSSYIAAGFNSCGNGPGSDTISNWLIAPEMWLADGSQISFYTRTTAGSTHPDRLQVRVSLQGGSTNVGDSAEDVGDFSMLVLDINPLLVVGGYPEYWMNYTAVLSGVGEPKRGRFAFRYYITDGGLGGLNSDYIGIDSVTLTGLARSYSSDWNGNRIPDECDIAGGWSRDDNMNDVPDECEVVGYSVGWGLNDFGQAGAVTKDCTAVSAGAGYSLALKTDGSIAGWGSNANGLMDGIPGGSDFAAVSAGYDHCMALRYDGTIACWGANDSGQCSVPTGSQFVAVSAGRKFSLAIRSDGTLAGWGANDVGQTNVPTGNNFVRISAGDYHAIALRSDNSMAAWGISGDDDRAVPLAGNEFTAVAAGGSHSLALKFDGSIAAWGSNAFGQLNNIPTTGMYRAISAGGNHSLAVRSSGSVIGWGGNENNQITDIPRGYDHLAIAAGAGHALAIAVCPLAADLTDDCAVDANDLLVFSNQWLMSGIVGDCHLSADLAGSDCHVDFCDYGDFAAEWLHWAETTDLSSIPLYNLLFSEYVEGSGDNKALEIYNAGDTPVNLGLCHIKAYHNGSATPRYIISLNPDLLAPGDVFVIGSCCATSPVLWELCDQWSNSIQFNGDDALELVCDGRTLDVIGQVGFLPPTGYWGTGDAMTKDHTLRRKCFIAVGDAKPFDEFLPFLQWDGLPQDTFDGLGWHCP